MTTAHPPLPADRAQDARIAEALGVTLRPITTIDHRGATADIGYTDPPRRMPDGRMGVMAHKCPAYSSDPVAFEALMQEIGKRGMGIAYIAKLSTMANLDDQPNYECFGWSLLSAPLNVKARAALAVLKEATNG